MQKTTTKLHYSSHNVYLAIGPCLIKKSAFSFLPTKNIKETAFIDGGLNHLKKLNKLFPLLFKNVVSFGDGDSSKSPMTYKKDNQEISDLSFFLDKKFIQKKSGIYLLYGFLGKRIDHQLINIGEISHFILKMHKIKCPTTVIVDQQMIYLPPGKHRLQLKGQFSFITLEDANVSMKGDCEFTILKAKKIQKLSSKGLSNTGFGEVLVSSNRPFILITKKTQSFLTLGII